MKVLIIGAGPTGLLVAQGLRKAHIEYEIFERHNAGEYFERQRDWGIALHWGTEYMKGCLPDDLASRIDEAKCDPFGVNGNEAYCIGNGLNGDALLRSRDGEMIKRVSKKKLVRLLSEGIDIQYGKKLTCFKVEGSEVTVAFADGSCAIGSFLLGADSAKSTLRSLLLGSEVAATFPLPVTTLTTSFSLQVSQIRHIQRFPPFTKYGLHPQTNDNCLLTILIVSHNERPETWEFQVMYKTLDRDSVHVLVTNEQRLQYLHSKASEWADPWRSLLRWIPGDAVIYEDVVSHWKHSKLWENHEGRITLAGDSAHPMTPYRGQALNNSVRDAANYVEAIKAIADGEAPVRETMNTYDIEVFERGRVEIGLSTQQMYSMHNFKAFMDSPLVKFGLKPRERL